MITITIIIDITITIDITVNMIIIINIISNAARSRCTVQKRNQSEEPCQNRPIETSIPPSPPSPPPPLGYNTKETFSDVCMYLITTPFGNYS